MRKIKRAAMTAAAFAVLSGPVLAEGVALVLKTGTFTLSEESQSLSGIPLAFDDSASGVFGIELEWRMAGGTGFGLELVRYGNDWSSGIGTRGDNDTTGLLFNAKKYFDVSPSVHPYVGAGIGFAGIDFDGPGGSASGSDLALQAMAGIDFRVGEKLGIYTEVKYLTSEPEDDFGDNVDVTGTGFFVGLSVGF